MKINTLKYSNTNTYLIEGEKGYLLFDTGWAGTFDAFCRCMGDIKIPVQKIDCILISHFHPDHMGIAENIADLGARIVIPEVQKDYIHSADAVFAKDKNSGFLPIKDETVRFIKLSDSRDFLKELGIDGEILHTPGHSDDSISLILDSGHVFVGDLNPLYEIEAHKGTTIVESWEKILKLRPREVYYGHAPAASLGDNTGATAVGDASADLYELVEKIIKYINKGMPLAKIQKKTGAGEEFIEDVNRMYLTHPGVSVQGILDRIEIKGR
jgi:glyoxylase-like metal-dependent hydrolase (beta-lactamase superfamily II)